jgi:ketosteroid isomerase-like protein
VLSAILAIAVLAAASEPGFTAGTAAIEEVLAAFHTAASEADGETYFGLFTDDAVYLGTDASERWTVEEFRAFADPYFSEGRGWTYTVTSRNIAIGPNGSTAWFDELLWNESYGTCRGTGVLIETPDGWRIAQYHLTFPIPNALAKEMTERIKLHEHRGAIDE